MIKKILILSGLCFMVLTSITAQDTNTNWTNQITEAKKMAAEDGKDIMMVFSGSDWCRPCMKFKKDVLDTPDFKAYAKDKLVVLYLDFPARKKNKLSKEQTAHNEALAEKYNKSGFFPKIIVLNTDEEVLSEPSFSDQSAGQFISAIAPLKKKG